jgi:hypothetical protein
MVGKRVKSHASRCKRVGIKRGEDSKRNESQVIISWTSQKTHVRADGDALPGGGRPIRFVLAPRGSERKDNDI